ncbi:translesion DNA synthesis-associated protein ImuA [Roseateles sp. DC23W]|uniref:Translesion DNA synthesis-associated protein ImuA n=1 Tax=Pelomonas dachongensis TaxID=3299029 RepID=A0ABW7EUS5_9BURK
MLPATPGLVGASPPHGLPSPAQNAALGAHEPLPHEVEAALWRGDQLGGPVADVLSSGFPELDVHLPGGGWPCGALTEVLVSQFSIAELRLLSPVIAHQTRAGRSVALIGPSLSPHAPGLRHDGIDERHLVWIDVDTPRDRLWATEQVVKAGSFGAVIAWLPLVRAEQIRRLQVLASRCKGPLFLCRPEVAAQDSSAAPLRVMVRVATDWQIAVDVLKRKGVPLEQTLHLTSMPGGLASIMTPRLRYPSRLTPIEPSHAVVSPAVAAVRQRSELAESSKS